MVESVTEVELCMLQYDSQLNLSFAISSTQQRESEQGEKQLYILMETGKDVWIWPPDLSESLALLLKE